MVDRIVTVPDSLELPASVKVPSARLSDSTATGRAVLAAADSAAARAAIGISELSGTGMPNGVVTASPGTYYTDTAGTNGAWRWLKKSGTGNTGWDVVHGDTGWRSIASWANGVQDTNNQVGTFNALVSPGGAGSVAVRRVGDVVSLRVRGALSITADETNLFATPRSPIGFRLTGYTTVPYASYHAGSTPILLRAVEGSGYLVFRRQPPGPVGWGSAMWITDDPWPTTLPGAPG